MILNADKCCPKCLTAVLRTSASRWQNISPPDCSGGKYGLFYQEQEITEEDFRILTHINGEILQVVHTPPQSYTSLLLPSVDITG